MKDAEVKLVLSKFSRRQLNIGKTIPDGCFECNDGSVLIVEYENSSRGVSYHVLKYMRLLPQAFNGTLLIVNTSFHRQTHVGDYANGLYAATLNKKKDLKIVFKTIDAPMTLYKLVHGFINT
jgi:3-deoxy-D-arabino-heptulosonate 7-phosphate (DAHP) synthase